MNIVRRPGPSSGFTIFELLASGAVVAMLLLAFAPALQQSRDAARTRLCAANLAQIGKAVALYAEANNDALPGNQHSQPSWIRALAESAGTNSYRCPEALLQDAPTRKWTIALNDFLSRRPYGARQLDYSKRSSIPAPEETMMFGEVERDYREYDHFHFADAREKGVSSEAFGEQVAAEQHGSEANYLFSDGRVDLLSWNTTAKLRLQHPGSRFVHPAGEWPEKFASK